MTDSDHSSDMNLVVIATWFLFGLFIAIIVVAVSILIKDQAIDWITKLRRTKQVIPR